MLPAAVTNEGAAQKVTASINQANLLVFMTVLLL
jgi:hypothetical protein